MATVPQPWNDELVSVAAIGQREFQRFSLHHGVYCVPVDEDEEVRLNEFHDILLSWSPISRLIYPDRDDIVLTAVLDCGCGTGIWADEVLTEYDGEVEVTGIDIFLGRDFESSRIRWNLNAPFRLHQDELRRDRYDLINSRFLTSGIDSLRWPSYVQDLFNRLNPGGWLQMTEAYMNIQSDSGRRDEAPSIGRWWDLYSTALERQGKDPRVGTTVMNRSQRAWGNLTDLMRDAGFVGVQTQLPRLPIGDWPSDGNSREVGVRVLEFAKSTLEALGVWACCQIHGMTADAFRQLIEGCSREMQDSRLRLYIQLYLVWGQRPHRDHKQTGAEQASSMPAFAQSMPPPGSRKS